MNAYLRFHKCTVIIFILLLWSSNLYAYEVCTTQNNNKELKWDSDKTTYHINSSGGPSASIDAIIAGMQTWTDVVTADFTITYFGETGNTSHGIDDGMNIVTFGSLPAGTLAENKFWYSDSPSYQFARIVDSDVRFNTYYSWSTNGSSGAYDVENVATHELGHSLCLADLSSGSDSEKTMYYSAGKGETKKSTLHQDDINGITYLYTCQYAPVRIARGNTKYYSSLQDAYDDASPDETIESHAITFSETLLLDLPDQVSFEGGYNCDYAPTTNPSVISGTVNLINGAITMENFSIE